MSLEDRYEASLEQLHQQAQDDRESTWLSSTLALLDQSSPGSLHSRSILAAAHIHQNEDEGPILIVHWIADDPDVDRFVLLDAAISEEVVVPMHSVDYENNIAEAASSVVFFASIRNQDLADHGIQVDLNAVAAVALIGKDGVRTEVIKITR